MSASRRHEVDAEAMTYSERIRQFAEEDPDAVALVFAASDATEISVTRHDLCVESLRAASLLEEKGADRHSLVDVALPNGVEHVVACLGAWWLGACVLPLSPSLPEAELELVLASAGESGRRQLLIGDPPTITVPTVTRATLASRSGFEARARPRIVPNPGRAMPSGGSSGRPKVIVSLGPLLVASKSPPNPMVVLFGGRPGQR